MQKCLLTIITVCFNSAANLENTIKSILSQTYKNIEYIVIDGGSEDGTVEIIKKYSSNITVWVSERDRGIYDAMNKGLNIATGDFIFFLNSGDIFYEKETLERIAKYLDSCSASIVLGQIMRVDNKKELGITRSKTSISPWYSPPHQAIFVSRILYCQNRFNLFFRILGDRELWLRLKGFGVYNCVPMDEIVVRYNVNGVSSNPRNALIIWKETTALAIIYSEQIPCFLIIGNLLKAITKIVLSKIINVKSYNLLAYYYHSIKFLKYKN